jgi:hypothetical protein
LAAYREEIINMHYSPLKDDGEFGIKGWSSAERENSDEMDPVLV